MVLRLLLIVLLIALPLSIATLPPDPLWIPGVYDGGDYDDVVSVVDSPNAVVTPPTPVSLAPLVIVPDRVQLSDWGILSGPAHLSRVSRSPPQG